MALLKTNFMATVTVAILLSACGGADSSTDTSTATSAQRAPAQTQAVSIKSFSPYVDASGNISRPTDFLTGDNWTHLGAWAVVNETGEGNGMHNVYTTHDVVAAYKQTGKFPDGAVLVKEVRGASATDLTTGRAHWATDNAVWFVSIKDTTSRFPDNPLWGDGWGWALFQADAPAKQVATDYKNDCLSCHVPVKDSDWIYTYAYPVLSE